ncbi:hypothetical protein Hanom_Chr10g00889481 [Helianthus anomalus]
MQERLWRAIVRPWFIDSSCSRHVTEDLSQLNNKKRVFDDGFVNFAGEETGRITMKGTVRNGVLTFSDVNYVPDL